MNGRTTLILVVFDGFGSKMTFSSRYSNGWFFTDQPRSKCLKGWEACANPWAHNMKSLQGPHALFGLFYSEEANEELATVSNKTCKHQGLNSRAFSS